MKGTTYEESGPSSHPLLEPGVSTEWPAIQQIIGQEYLALTSRVLDVNVFFVSAHQIEKDHEVMGASGDVVGYREARAERLRGTSAEAFAKFYTMIFHELEHLDDQDTGFEQISTILVQQGLLLPYNQSDYEELYNAMMALDPIKATSIDKYFIAEHMLVESRAELFALTLSDRVFSGHPIKRAAASHIRNGLFSTAEMYSGGMLGFDYMFDRDVLALLSVAGHETVEEAWDFLSQPFPVVFLFALEGLRQIRDEGFHNAVIAPVNDFFARNYGLRPYRFHYDWSGKPDELESIAHPDHEIYERFAYCSKPDAFDASAEAVMAMSTLFGQK